MASRDQLSKQEWTERTAAKVALAQKTLAAEVTALQSGEDWQRYLAFQARLHTYSPNNVMLITAWSDRMCQERGAVHQTKITGSVTTVRENRRP